MLASWLTSFGVSFLCHVVMDLYTKWQADRAAVAQGRAEAVADGRAEAAASARIARAEENVAESAHRSDPSDSAFDLSFRRD